MPSVLIVDDEPNIRRMVGALLASEGYEVREAPDGTRGVALATEAEPDLALVDLMMPGEIDGMGVLTALRERLPELPVIMMSGRAGLSDAVRATKLGAFTFLEKPLTPEGVLLALASALELRQVKREARTLRADLGLAGEMIGNSPALRRVREMIAKVAPSDARVLITGESGTGKELVAAAIHSGGSRKDRPFVRDEVGDLGAEAQAKLLRAIESGEIERVGGSKPIRVDVRIVSATNKDLTRAVADGTFREDLYFRLNVIPLPIPPLRERPDDIPALVRHFSQVHRGRTGQPLTSWSAGALDTL